MSWKPFSFASTTFLCGREATISCASSFPSGQRRVTCRYSPRRSGKSVSGKIFTSPRRPWVPTIRPTTRPAAAGASAMADFLDDVILDDDLGTAHLLDEVVAR